jgi:hypothetical protein
MNNRRLALVATLLAVGATGVARADDTSSRKDPGAAGLEVTMRIIEDPAAISPEAITRRITLPVAGGQDGAPPPNETEGRKVSETAREAGRESGEDVAERARELAERAGEQREEFGRSRADELRPEPPGRPEIQPPVPPRP